MPNINAFGQVVQETNIHKDFCQAGTCIHVFRINYCYY